MSQVANSYTSQVMNNNDNKFDYNVFKRYIESLFNSQNYINFLYKNFGNEKLNVYKNCLLSEEMFNFLHPLIKTELYNKDSKQFSIEFIDSLKNNNDVLFGKIKEMVNYDSLIYSFYYLLYFAVIMTIFLLIAYTDKWVVFFISPVLLFGLCFLLFRLYFNFYKNSSFYTYSMFWKVITYIFDTIRFIAFVILSIYCLIYIMKNKEESNPTDETSKPKDIDDTYIIIFLVNALLNTSVTFFYVVGYFSLYMFESYDYFKKFIKHLDNTIEIKDDINKESNIITSKNDNKDDNM